MSELRPAVRGALTDTAFSDLLTLSAVNRRGRQTNIRIVCSSLRKPDGSPQGAILVMEQEDGTGSA